MQGVRVRSIAKPTNLWSLYFEQATPGQWFLQNAFYGVLQGRSANQVLSPTYDVIKRPHVVTCPRFMSTSMFLSGTFIIEIQQFNTHSRAARASQRARTDGRLQFKCQQTSLSACIRPLKFFSLPNDKSRTSAVETVQFSTLRNPSVVAIPGRHHPSIQLDLCWFAIKLDGKSTPALLPRG